MTTRDPKAAARRRRAKQRAKGMHDLKMIGIGVITGMFALAMILLSAGQFNRAEPVYIQVPATQTTAVQNKAYSVATPPEDTGNWDCKNSGNHICGPGNPQKAKPGLYNHNRRVVTWDDLKAWGIVK